MTMTETKVKQLFPVSNGIMSLISSSGGYSFSDDADLLLIATCGQRTISPVVEMLLDTSGNLTDANMTRLANLMLSEYKDTWDRIKSTLELEYNPLQASQYNETETTDSTGENTDSSTDVHQNDVSAMDEVPDNYISDGKNTIESNGNGSSISKTTRTLTRASNNTSYKPVDLLKSEIDLRVKNMFTKHVIDDVKNYISMPIY